MTGMRPRWASRCSCRTCCGRQELGLVDQQAGDVVRQVLARELGVGAEGRHLALQPSREPITPLPDAVVVGRGEQQHRMPRSS
jgi:hypothetical protein